MTNKILDTIEKEFISNNQVFFSYVWREKIYNLLTTESKYNELALFLSEKINEYRDIINLFNPADKTEYYLNENFKHYFDAIKNFAFLVNMREILLDSRCTEEMRANIEYTICKVYNVKYSEEFNTYI